MIIRASESPEDSFGKAFEEFKDQIFRHCYFHVHERDVALEIMQDAFMKTWEYIAAGNDIENVRAFLYRVATNLVYNWSKKKREVSLNALQEAGFDPPDEDENLGRDCIAERSVITVLGKIEEPYRTAVTLRYVEGLSPKEIAEITGQSSNTISVRINRGLKQLKSHLPHGSES